MNKRGWLQSILIIVMCVGLTVGINSCVNEHIAKQTWQLTVVGTDLSTTYVTNVQVKNGAHLVEVMNTIVYSNDNTVAMVTAIATNESSFGPIIRK